MRQIQVQMATISQCVLEDFSGVAYALRHMLPVQIFQEGDGVLAADACQLFEGGDIHSWRFCFLCGDQAAQLFEGSPVKDQLVGNFDQDFIAQQQGDDFLGASLVDL